MPITIIETVGSRSGTVSNTDPNDEIHLTLSGSDAEDAIRFAIESYLPAFLRGMPLRSYDKNHLGNGVWTSVAKYERYQPRKPGTVTLEFDTTGENVKIMQSLASRYYAPLGQPVIDFRGAINVTKSGGSCKVDGVEISVPQFNFTIKRTYGPPDAPLNGAQLQAFYDFTGYVAADPIAVVISGILLTFPGDTLLFKGVTGSQTSIAGNQFGMIVPHNPEDGGMWDLSVRWTYSPNITNLQIGDIVGIEKRGHEYLWVAYEDDVDQAVLIKVARQVSVEQVYPRAILVGLFT